MFRWRPPNEACFVRGQNQHRISIIWLICHRCMRYMTVQNVPCSARTPNMPAVQRQGQAQIQARPAGFAELTSKGAGLMPGLREAITMFYALAAGLSAVPERCCPGSVPGQPGLVRCRSGLGRLLGIFCLYSGPSQTQQRVHCTLTKHRRDIPLNGAGGMLFIASEGSAAVVDE